MTADSPGRTEREVDHVRVMTSTLRGHQAAEGVEFHAETGEFGKMFTDMAAVAITAVAGGVLEVLDDVRN